MAYTLRRDDLGDGEETTVYVVRHPLDEVRPRVALFRQPRRLDWWCAKNQVEEAMVGGFYRRDPFRPLGDLWLGGRRVETEPFPDANRDLRPALHVTDGEVRIAPRGELPAEPAGDLLQAGPLLVRDGEVVFDPAADTEGFSAGCDQFDSDITEGRHPRAAIGIADDTLWMLVCDGRRSRVDAGLTLGELGERDARPRLPQRDEPRRRRLDDARPPPPPAQPPLQRAGPGGARVAPDRHRAAAGIPTRRVNGASNRPAGSKRARTASQSS